MEHPELILNSAVQSTMNPMDGKRAMYANITPGSNVSLDFPVRHELKLPEQEIKNSERM